MAAGATYTPIATQTVGTPVSSVTFSSIPATYTDLILVLQGGAASADDLYIQFNSDTSSNYSFTSLQGNGSAASSQQASTQTSIKLNSPNGGYLGTTLATNMIIQIQNYANSTTYKTILVRANLASGGVNATVGIWKKTPEAINTIKLVTGSQNLLVGSTFTLFGIQAA